MFRGLRFRPYQLVAPLSPAANNNRPDLVTWIPTKTVSKVFPKGIPASITWQDSLSVFENATYTMFTFDLRDRPGVPRMQPAILIKFLDAVARTVSQITDKQRSYDPFNDIMDYDEADNPYLDLTLARPAPIDFSELAIQAVPVATMIRITGLDLEAIVTAPASQLNEANLERLESWVGKRYQCEGRFRDDRIDAVPFNLLWKDSSYPSIGTRLFDSSAHSIRFWLGLGNRENFASGLNNKRKRETDS